MDPWTSRAPSFRPLGLGTRLLRSPLRMWMWTQRPSQPGPRGTRRLALWCLLEPRLQLGLSHLLVSKASRAQDVLKMAGGQRVGQERRQRRGGARNPRAGEGGCWAGGPHGPHAHRPSCPSSVAGGRGTRALMPACTAPALTSSPTSILTALCQPPGKAQPPALQMRNWPTVPANTGDEWRRRRAGSTGLPRVPRAGPGLS